MPPQQNQNQPNYDFIMNPNAPSAKKSLLPAGNSTGQRIAIVAIIGGVLIAFLIVLMLILGSGGDNKQSFLKVTQEQTELIRIAALADEATDQELKNFAVNTESAITSDRQRLLGVLGENGIAFNDKQLVLGQNAKTDQALETAKAAANFDVVLRDTLVEQLTNNRASLKTAFEQSGNAEIKESLGSVYANTGLLLKQVEQGQTITP